MYQPDEYDLAGFTVGVVEKERIIDGSAIQPGDVLVGLPSSGAHSNGFSLIRKALFEQGGLNPGDRPEELGGPTLAEELLTPTRIYVSALKPLFEQGLLHGVAHITGGGFVEKVPRILPAGTAAEFRVDSWTVPPIFDMIERYGQVDHMEMYNIFNMGIGMVLVVDPDKLDALQTALNQEHEDFYLIGQVVEDRGERVVLTRGD